MTPPSLIDRNGRAFSLERQIDSGGEAAIFTLTGDATRLAKVYHQPPNDQTRDKLEAMLVPGFRHLATVAAWPSDLLFSARTRKLAGFVMPRLIDCQAIWHLYNPLQRLKCFPRMGWKFQVRAALNLAAAFDEVHKAGCLIADVNEKNAFVSQQAIVWLLDCDSFQFKADGKQYLCDVGVPHYISPELQGKALRGLVRTENHDRFGLAVLIYQLLFVGRHPYAGVYLGADDPPFQQLISDFRFSQGPMARSWAMAPAPHTPTFADINPELGVLFRRAFERGSEKDARPRPKEWISALQQLEKNTIVCPADPGHNYWRGAKSCVWCRLEGNGGPEYYFGVAVGIGTFEVDEVKLRDVIRRLRAAPLVEFEFDPDRFAPAQKVTAKPLPNGLDDYRQMITVVSITCAICVLAIPLGFIRGFIGVSAFIGAVFFGAWLAILRSQSPWHREYRRRKLARIRAIKTLEEVEADWERIVFDCRREHSDLTESLQSLISDCRGLASKHQAEIQRLTANAESLALARHMHLHLIADAEIAMIGTGRKQTLAAYNIFTAADINESTIRGIKGFGDALTNNLVEWKHEIVRRFRFNPSADVSPSEQRSVTVQCRTRQSQIITDIEKQLVKLESLEPACRAKIQKLEPEITAAIGTLEQANANLRLLSRKR